MRSQIGLVAVLLCGGATLLAQEPPCGVSAVKETAALTYPPIARAAHVTGVVIVRVEFAKDGMVKTAEVWRGPEMLRANVLSFAKGLQANEYGGSRTCLLSVTFAMKDQIPPDFHGDMLGANIKRTTITQLHYSITATTVPLSSNVDPAGKIIRKRFLGIF